MRHDGGVMRRLAGVVSVLVPAVMAVGVGVVVAVETDQDRRVSEVVEQFDAVRVTPELARLGQQTAYLDTVRARVPRYADRSDAALLHVGEQVCQDVAGGRVPGEPAAVVWAARAALCPGL